MSNIHSKPIAERIEWLFELAHRHGKNFRSQVEHIFGSGHGSVYPLVCGFETDDEALAIHGTDNTILDLAGISVPDETGLEPRLADLLPDMPNQMRADLLPLLHGNLEHIAQVREQARRHERILDIEHREWMICLGRGFDFFHTPTLVPTVRTWPIRCAKLQEL